MSAVLKYTIVRQTHLVSTMLAG